MFSACMRERHGQALDRKMGQSPVGICAFPPGVLDYSSCLGDNDQRSPEIIIMDNQEISRRHFAHGVVSATGGALAAATWSTKRTTMEGAAAGEISLSATDARSDSRPVEANESRGDMTSQETQHDPFRRRLRRGLGGPWPEPSPLEPAAGEPIDRDGYRIEPVSFLAEPDDRIPALLLVPDGATAAAPAAAICVWHQHNGQYHLGKSEPAGLEGDPQHHTGAALARLEGRVALEEVQSRFPNFEIAWEKLVRIHSINVRGFASMPIEFSP